MPRADTCRTALASRGSRSLPLSNYGIEPAWAVRPYKVTLPAKQPPAKDATCPESQRVEGRQEIIVYVTAGTRDSAFGVEGATVDLAVPDTGFGETKTTTWDGSVVFSLGSPGVANLKIFVAEDWYNDPPGWYDLKAERFLPDARSVRVLPDCKLPVIVRFSYLLHTPAK